MKRDFGITAAVVTALAISTAAATAAAVSLATTIPTAEVVNTPAEGTAAVLQTVSDQCTSASRNPDSQPESGFGSRTSGHIGGPIGTGMYSTLPGNLCNSHSLY